MPLVIEGQERPKKSLPGRSQHLRVPHSWAGLSDHSLSGMPEVERYSFPRHSSGSGPVCEATSRWGVTEQKHSCFYILFKYLNNV